MKQRIKLGVVCLTRNTFDYVAAGELYQGILKDLSALEQIDLCALEQLPELAEAGVITNRLKKTNPGKYVASFLMGTRKLYDFVDGNPDVAMLPVDYVNNPVEVMKEDNIVSVNSCVQIDLMGQAASESVGLTQISGVGGQVDFANLEPSGARFTFSLPLDTPAERPEV